MSKISKFSKERIKARSTWPQRFAEFHIFKILNVWKKLLKTCCEALKTIWSRWEVFPLSKLFEIVACNYRHLIWPSAWDCNYSHRDCWLIKVFETDNKSVQYPSWYNTKSSASTKSLHRSRNSIVSHISQNNV